MKIIQERLERESDVSLVQTAPTVTYEVKLRDGAVSPEPCHVGLRWPFVAS